MSKPEEKATPDGPGDIRRLPRATKGKKPADGLNVTPETSAKPGNLAAEEKDAADILSGNATGDKAKVQAAIDRHAKTDKRTG
jgi:hypothetical protein